MKKIIVFCICFLITTNAYAQTAIKLKSGGTVEGKLVEKTDAYIKLNIHGVDLTYWMDEIESIKSKDTDAQALSTDAQALSKEPTIIKGKVIFDDYKQGYIKVMAFDKPLFRNRADNFHLRSNTAVAKVTLAQPGPYELTVPANVKKVFIIWYNDSANDGPPMQVYDPHGYYGEPEESSAVPIILDKPKLNIDLVAF